MILFSITAEDAQKLAVDILQRTLTEKEIQYLKHSLKMPDWHEELSGLIAELPAENEDEN